MITFYELLDYIVPNNYFTAQQTMFTLQGLWMPKNACFQIIYLLCVVPHTLITTVWLVISEIIMMVKLHETDAKQTMLTLSVTLIHVLATVRIFHWNLLMKRRLGPLVKILNRNINFDVFNLNHVHFNDIIDKRQKCNGYEEIRLKWKDIRKYLEKDKVKYLAR